MALTKVRSPVAAIDNIINGTSAVDIASAGASIIATAGGVTSLTMSTAGITVGAGLTTVSDIITSEVINLATAAGASATLQTTISQGELETTTAHPLVLGANSIDGLTIQTTGKTTLGVQGTATTDLINKTYVDTAIALLPALSDIVFAATSTGSIQIPTDGANDFIVNWGITASINNTFETVTFDTAFPNSVLGAFATDVVDASKEASSHVHTITTSNMRVVQSGSGSSRQVYWLAFGF